MKEICIKNYLKFYKYLKKKFLYYFIVFSIKINVIFFLKEVQNY